MFEALHSPNQHKCKHSYSFGPQLEAKTAGNSKITDEVNLREIRMVDPRF